MKAVIMAGGRGTRLREITKNEIPKPMVKLSGKPIIKHQIERLKENGIYDITIIIGYLGETIKDYFKDGQSFGVRIDYIEEEQPLGTAGALFYLKNNIKEDFILLFGDIIFDISIDRMINFHKNNDAYATLFVHPNSHPYDSDLLILDKNHKIIEFDSKINTREYFYDNCVNAGIYIISKALLNDIKILSKIDLEKDVLFPNLKEKAIYGYYSTEYVKDVGTVERIRIAEEDIKNGILKCKNLNNKQKCIFLDRDGTINKYSGLISNTKDLELEKHASEAIKKINSSGYITIVITNQPQVARGLCDLKDIEKINNKLKTLLGNEGAYIDDIYYCPHHPDGGYPEENKEYKIKCNCRKPNIGLIEEAVRKYNIDLSKSWFIGDTTIDIQTGANAKMKTVLLRTGKAGEDKKYEAKPNYEFDNLLDAVRFILK